MKTKAIVCGLALSICLHPWALLSQGSLTPPGPPAPTMKTLDQVQPRTPISSVPFTINGPGSYYLTTNLTGAAGQNGITVSADDVTIDLNGFDLVGVAGASSGIASSGSHTNLTLRDGAIRDWPVWGVSTASTVGGRYERLRFARDGSGGLNIGNDSAVVECVVARSPTTGVVFGGIGTGTSCIIRNCVVSGSSSIGIQAGGGSTVSGCTVEYPAGNGIVVSANCIVTGCAVNSGNAVGIVAGQNCSVLDSDASNNTASGITAGDASIIRHCTTGNNGGGGIVVFGSGTIQNCAARQNSNGGLFLGNGCSVSGCTVVSNLSNGITVGNSATVVQSTVSGSFHGILTGSNCLVQACTSSLNSSNGIFVAGACTVKDCTVAQNGGSGICGTFYCLITGNLGNANARGLTNNANIYVTGDDNQIMDNNVTFGGRGIKTDTQYNLVVKNKASVNTADFDLAPGTVAGAITNNPVGAGPWVNFSF